MSRGKRYDSEPKLNMKKVVAVVIAIAVIIMFIIGIKTLLSNHPTNDKVTSTSSYFPVYTQGKWGVIDQTGKTIIAPAWDEMITIPDSNSDVFICRYDADYEQQTYKTKVINQKNQEIIKGYDEVSALENIDENQNLFYLPGVLKVRKGTQYGLVDFSGKEILPVEYTQIKALAGIENSILVQKEDKWGLVDTKADTIIPVAYQEIQAIGNQYQNGYIVINDDKQYGVIDFTKKVILECNYEEIKPITGNGLYVVKEDGKQKVINKDKETVLDSGFDDIAQIAAEHLVFVKNKKYGVMDKTGKIEIPANYDEISYLTGENYLAKSKGKYGIVDRNNETKVEFAYDAISMPKDSGIYILDKNTEESSHILNSNLEEKLTGIVSDINVEKGYLRIYQEEDYTYYNLQLEPVEAQNVLSSANLFVKKQDGKYGFVDKEGNEVVKAMYEDAMPQNKYGFCSVKLDGKWGAIDQEGNVVCQPQYALEENVVIDFIGKWHLAQDINSYYYTDEE